METTLMRVIGALFCHDAKRARTRTGKIEINRGSADKHIEIAPHPDYGQPGPLAHKALIALIKKHSDYGKPIQSDITFGKRELSRLIGRNTWGGKDSEQLAFALHSIQSAFITARFKSTTGVYAEERFNIFPRVIFERANSATDPIVSCTVTLAAPIVASLQADHFACYNFSRIQQMGTIGQAFYLRAFFHFANIYSDGGRRRLEFSKRYDDVCSEWLGGLTVFQQKSKILEQLGPHLEHLVTSGFLASFSIDKATDGAFKLSFRPGQGFYQDYERYYRHRQQGQLQWEFHSDRTDHHEPMKIAALFEEKRTGKPAGMVANVLTGDIAIARELIERLGYHEVPAFLDYAFSRARQTRYDVQRLAGLRQYVPDFLKTRDQRRRDRERDRTQEINRQEQKQLERYDDWRRKHAEIIFNALTTKEQEEIRAEAARRTKPGMTASMLAEINHVKIIQERYPNAFPPITELQARSEL
jgi:hypothetical protein